MSRCLHFESLGGASGDMILGALIGLGVSCEELNQELQSLNIDPFNIIVDDVVMGGESSSTFNLNEDGCGIFEGNISIENNGGFSSFT